MTFKDRMTLPAVDGAGTILDGGVDAVAALDASLAGAHSKSPVDGRGERTHAIGRAMPVVLDETVNPGQCASPLRRTT